MKSLKVIGYIFCTLGVMLLIAGFVFGISAASAASSIFGFGGNTYANSVLGTIFIAAAAPFFAGCVPMFIIGIVGFYLGRDIDTIIGKLPSQENPIRVELQSPSIDSTYQSSYAASGKSKIVCGSCGVANDLDAVFCKKCGNQFQ